MMQRDLVKPYISVDVRLPAPASACTSADTVHWREAPSGAVHHIRRAASCRGSASSSGSASAALWTSIVEALGEGSTAERPRQPRVVGVRSTRWNLVLEFLPQVADLAQQVLPGGRQGGVFRRITRLDRKLFQRQQILR